MGLNPAYSIVERMPFTVPAHRDGVQAQEDDFTASRHCRELNMGCFMDPDIFRVSSKDTRVRGFAKASEARIANPRAFLSMQASATHAGCLRDTEHPIDG